MKNINLLKKQPGLERESAAVLKISLPLIAAVLAGLTLYIHLSAPGMYAIVQRDAAALIRDVFSALMLLCAGSLIFDLAIKHRKRNGR